MINRRAMFGLPLVLGFDLRLEERARQSLTLIERDNARSIARALAKYAIHLAGCSVFRTKKCNCGLLEFLEIALTYE